ncbi:endonuclease/exonuclease/phosphatase family protein [Nonomuraea lactucae]|uniref:endonuclease/exonuclease/phosphatase family protein n=1 Tax=Nonomuraea lactucae TaxID=2249762 RepID=UPI000DE3CB99|nr:endonuclease/exonuclease/phosphatase family protein [Nonomuraea lactucae]
MSTLRVATLNLWGTNGPWPQRLDLIRRELARLRPDVVGLQEVMREDGYCQAREIADGLGYEIVYGPACDRDGRIQGNAVLSRLPVREQREFALPTGGEEPRALLYALLQSEHGDLPVFVTHLTWQQSHGSTRLRQVRHTVARVAELSPAMTRLPPVVMGDFNADPDSDEIRYLRGLAVVEGQSVYFADAWTYGGDGSAGATYDRANDYARQAREPSRRIDYIFTGGDELLRGEPLHAELAFTEPEVLDGVRVWPSDHYGLVADIVLAAREE